MSVFNKRLTKSLVENGYIVPSSVEEIKIYLQNNKIEEVPPEFEVSIMADSSRIEYSNNQYKSEDLDTEENFAQAAREGKEIPEEIKRKMDNDRENSNPEK